MKNNSGLMFVLILLFLFNTLSGFAQNEEIPLWENVPGSIKSVDYIEKISKEENGVIRGANKVTQPTLTVFLANQNLNNGSAVIICPGGGYSNLAINKEGFKIAQWFNSLGISAFVLKYRLPSDLIMTNKSIGPLQDAQEAIRMVRRNATKWHLDSNKIGIMGFSAGGHLASTVSTQYAEKVYDSKDETSARPDFSILIYPVISMQDGITHGGSRKNLLGQNSSSTLNDLFSNEKRVNDKTPMTFLVHATDDTVVPVENSINYYLALKQNKVPVEMHIYTNGGHGFGLGVQEPSINWPKACEKWMAVNGYLPKL